MNSLSWFLYFADVVSALSTMFGVLGGIAMLVGVFGWLSTTIARGCRADKLTYYQPDNAKVKEWDEWIAVWNPLRLFLFRGFVLVFVSALFPAKSTLYAIVASEMGERIVKSEAVQGVTDDATKALRSWIKKQIELEKKAEK